jgi:hypothetical protein
MAAAFREIWSNWGVDEAANGAPGIIVPLRRSNLVQLVDGKNLNLFPSSKTITFKEHDKRALLDKVAAENMLIAALAPEAAMAAMMAGTAKVMVADTRVFEISGSARVGLGAKIDAKAPGASRAAATLNVLVLEEKPVKVAIRQVRTGGTAANPTFHSKLSFDPKRLLAEMNALWKPQANVVFSLVPSTPAEVDEAEVAKLLGSQASTAPLPRDVDMSKLWPAFAKLHVPKADMTMFLVERASANTDKVLGAAKPQAKIALVGDNRSERTMAHEAGHILGSFSGPAGWADYGHQGTDPRLLMRAGGAAWKIPFEHVKSYFNTRY